MSVDGRLLAAMEGARNCVVNLAAVKRGESVLVILHTASDLRIGQAVASICREVGANVDLYITDEPRAQWGMRLQATEPLKAAASKADVIFANAVILDIGEARAAGARNVGLYMKSIEGFTGPGARLHAEIVFKICELAQAQWKNGKTITVTDDRGTNLTARIAKPHYAFGHVTQPLRSTQFANWSGGFGGLCLWPEWTANGTALFDVVTTFETRLQQPVKWTVKDGRVVKVEGDREHVEFIENAIRGGGKDADHFGEIMIGLNPVATIRFDNMFAGVFLETERHAGVMHMAVGSGTDFYDEAGNPKPPTVKTGIHLDCMSLKPTIKIDDEYCVKDGHLVWVDHPDVQALATKHGVTL